MLYTIFKATILFLVSSVKFLATPTWGLNVLGFTIIETVVITSLGGFTGILCFYYFGKIIIKYCNNRAIEKKNRRILNGLPVKNKRIFTKKNKIIVLIKQRFGLLGLAIVTPVIISIPIGSILAAKYFKNNPKTIPALLLSVLVWSIVLTLISNFFPKF